MIEKQRGFQDPRDCVCWEQVGWGGGGVRVGWGGVRGGDGWGWGRLGCCSEQRVQSGSRAGVRPLAASWSSLRAVCVCVCGRWGGVVWGGGWMGSRVAVGLGPPTGTASWSSLRATGLGTP